MRFLLDGEGPEYPLNKQNRIRDFLVAKNHFANIYQIDEQTFREVRGFHPYLVMVNNLLPKYRLKHMAPFFQLESQYPIRCYRVEYTRDDPQLVEYRQ
jgi:hypothetical protein